MELGNQSAKARGLLRFLAGIDGPRPPQSVDVSLWTRDLALYLLWLFHDKSNVRLNAEGGCYETRRSTRKDRLHHSLVIRRTSFGASAHRSLARMLVCRQRGEF